MGLAKTWRPGMLLAYAHRKLDGICLSISRNRTGYITVVTSRPTDITDKVKHCNWMALVARYMPPSVSVLGELHVPGRKASYVKSALAHSPEELRFNAFGIDRGLDANAELQLTNDTLESWGFRVIPFLVHKDAENRNTLGGDGYFEDPRDLLHDLPRDCEGYVMKTANMVDWFKLKPVKTIDLVVTGIKPGKGKFRGQCGALVVATSCGCTLARVSGMDDDTRSEITDDDIGRVVEVRYQYVGTQGRLRHPAFLRWRDDKAPENCTLDQDPELEKSWNFGKNE